MSAKLDIRRAIRRPGGGRSGSGLTMVELVVVMAIIGIMAVIAIPSFARMGLLWRNDLQSSARELYTLMRAARIYAGTYNVETALVYSTYRPEGSTANNLRAAALMYQHPTLTYTVGEDSFRHHLFVPVTSRDEGQLRPLPGNTGLIFTPFNTDIVAGTERVRVLFADTGEQSEFAAHVFEPSGRLRARDAERYTIRVGYTTDAGIDEQLVDPELGSIDTNFRTIDINIYRATGRVEIAKE